MFTDVMVDIETTGINSGRTAMIQLAAVRFNIETMEIDPVFFDAYLRMPSWRYWDDRTRDWWLEQNPELLRRWILEARDPGEVMREFNTWLLRTRGCRFWSKPLCFDYPFIETYCSDFQVPMYFKHWEAMDCRSFVRGCYFPAPPISDKDLPFTGDVHNALDDVLHQIKFVFHAQLHAKKRTLPDAQSEEQLDDGRDRTEPAADLPDAAETAPPRDA